MKTLGHGRSYEADNISAAQLQFSHDNSTFMEVYMAPTSSRSRLSWSSRLFVCREPINGVSVESLMVKARLRKEEKFTLLFYC